MRTIDLSSRAFLQGMVLLLVAWLTSACSDESAPQAPVIEPAPAPATPQPATEVPPAPWHQALMSEDRPDRDRDAGRKPIQVIEFLGIKPGMTVMDMFTAGGYYTEVLAAAVGPSGRVYAQNIDFLLTMNDGANDAALTARLAGNRLPNVVRLDAELDELGIEPGSLDAIMFALNFHDVYNGRGEEAALGLLRLMGSLLKPGGVIGLIDHHGDPDNDNAALHRIDATIVRELIPRAGLVLEAESALLGNPDDDRTRRVFAPELRGHTDRFLMRIRKPAS